MKKFLIFVFVLMVQFVFVVSKNFFLVDFWILLNSDLIVFLVFLLFVGVLLYFKVLSIIGKMFDGCVDIICKELDEVKVFCEEVQSLLVDYECKQKEVQEQVVCIVENVKFEVE